MKIVTGSRASAVLYNWLLANNIKGKVIVPANICESVPSVYAKAGIDVCICDISFNDWMLNTSKVNEIAEAENCNILHYNHTYGGGYLDVSLLAFPMTIIEDCCLSAPVFSPENVNKSSDLIIFSTGHTKVANIGYGGYGFTKDVYAYDRHRFIEYDVDNTSLFDMHVKLCHKEHCKINQNVVLSDWFDPSVEVPPNYFEAVSQEYESILKHKKLLNDMYMTMCNNFPADMNIWRYNVLVKNQEDCLDVLFSNNLYASKHYMSLGNGYFSEQLTPNTDYLESHVINLFNDRCYTLEQAEKTIDILKRVAIFI